MLYFTELNTTKEDKHIKKYYPCCNTQDICIISLYSTIDISFVTRLTFGFKVTFRLSK